MKYIKIQLYSNNHFHGPLFLEMNQMDILKEDLENLSNSEKMLISTVEMTKQEYENLGEFDGW